MEIYFKSFGNTHRGLALSSNGDISQTLTEIIESGEIKPNTKHSKLEPRLCASRVTEGYEGSYRPEGILFQTEQTPDFATPFDLMAITTGQTFTSSDHNSEFLEGAEQFIYENVEKMLEEHPNAAYAVEQLNEFRRSHGLEEVHGMNYNEVCFYDNITITPVALVGTSQEIKELAARTGMELYGNVRKYVEEQE